MRDEPRRAVRRWLKSTSNRTFVVYPLLVVLAELLLRGGELYLEPWFALLLAWGWLQYRLVGNYRLARGGGGPGLSVPPERLVTTGPYRFTRNPMYLGHLIFLLGVTLTFWSWFALIVLTCRAYWFHRRVLGDEERLGKIFGDEYTAYQARVKRWIPGIL